MTRRSALVVVRLLVDGAPHHVLVRTGRLDGWSLVTGTLGPGAANWRDAAVRACEERLAPLRCGADIELVQLTRTPLRWTSRSVSGTRTDHAAQVFGLRLLHEGGLARVPPGSYRLVPDSQLAEYRDGALLAVLAALPDLPLAWGGDPQPQAPATPAAPRTAPQRAPGRNAPEVWTPEVIARLGVDTDVRIAADIGVTSSAIAQRRQALGIARSPAAALEPRQWSPEDDRLLGTMPDTEVARTLGIPAQAVERRRVALDIAAHGSGTRKELRELAGAAYIDDYRAGVPVADIARKHGVSAATVTKAIERYLARELARSPR